MAEEVILESTSGLIIAPENRTKAVKALQKLESTVLEIVDQMLSGDQDAAKVYEPVLKMHYNTLASLFNPDFKANSQSFEKDYPELCTKVAKELKDNFSDFVKHSKAVPYLKVACSLGEKAIALSTENIFARDMLFNNPIIQMFPSFQESCAMIGSYESDYDANVNALTAHLVPLIGFLNNPLSLIESGE